MPPSFSCPSCGSSIQFDAKYVRIISCKYCKTVLEFGTGELTVVWQQGELIDFPSSFVVGSTTLYNSRQIMIYGRVRYEYDGGFFDVFFGEIDSKRLCIEEDDGMVTFFQESDWMNEPFAMNLSLVWKSLPMEGGNCFIQETWIQKLVHIQGSIDSLFVPNKEYEYYDGVQSGNRILIRRNPETKQIRVGRAMVISPP